MEEKISLIERQLERYPIALDLDQVAEALGLSRRTVDKLIDEGRIDHIVLDPAAERKQRRVPKAALIAFLTK